MGKRLLIPVLAAVLAAAPAATGGGDEGGAAAHEEALRKLLPEDWVFAPEAVPGLDRVMPGARSWFCRLQAKGGYPHERIVLAADGRVLARSNAAASLARARAARIELRREPAAWTAVEGGDASAVALLDAFHAQAPAAGRDAGNALTVAVALLHLLTHDGRFLSATVTARGADGLDVAVDWEQGSGTWSFEERSLWTFAFDRGGALTRLGKVRTSYEEHLRR